MNIDSRICLKVVTERILDPNWQRIDLNYPKNRPDTQTLPFKRSHAQNIIHLHKDHPLT